MTKVKLTATLAALAALSACKSSTDEAPATGSAESEAVVMHDCPKADDSGTINIAPGLSARVLKNGYGRSAVDGDYADTNVWLWHFDEEAEDRHGQFVWESGDDIFQFQIGSGQVIKGWDLGVPCMLIGETRELVVASELAYGERGRGDALPPNTPLIFTIELVNLTAPE
jgi:FKBP-type peptidyl-prolyl cis-trans isomerase FkpA